MYPVVNEKSNDLCEHTLSASEDTIPLSKDSRAQMKILLQLIKRQKCVFHQNNSDSPKQHV